MIKEVSPQSSQSCQRLQKHFFSDSEQKAAVVCVSDKNVKLFHLQQQKNVFLHFRNNKEKLSLVIGYYYHGELSNKPRPLKIIRRKIWAQTHIKYSIFNMWRTQRGCRFDQSKD